MTKIVAEGVECILAPNAGLMTGQGTNTYLVWAHDGSCAVIDPGPDDPSHLDAVVEAIAAHGVLEAMLVTHGHHDHDAGAPRLRERTGAPVLAWSREGTAAAARTLADGAEVVVGGRAVRALHTPGHRFDHLCFLLEDSGVLFAGDLVAGVGTVAIAPPEGDLTDYMASLRRLRDLPLRMVLPGHGPPIDTPRQRLDEYIAHREVREAQVLAALADGPRTAAAMVAAIYAEVDPALHPAAALSVTAHLLKLEREGRVVRSDAAEGEAWRRL